MYVLSNECMPGVYKIGCTTKTVKGRINELSSSTSIPLPFVEELSFFVFDVDKAEKKMHEELKEYRINQNKEFFRVDIDVIGKASKCLFDDYRDILSKLSEDVRFTGAMYYSERYKSLLDCNLKALKERGYRFDSFCDIFMKGDSYYQATCYSKICTQEEYQAWVKAQCEEDIPGNAGAEQNNNEEKPEE